jgi:hypothetical protein
MPGLRVLADPRFRLTLAAFLLCAALLLLGMLLIRQAADPAGQYGFDFDAYRAAARDIAAGRSPYAPSMLAAPVAVQGEVLYKYPPTFAQLLVPLAALPRELATGAWVLLQATFAYAAVWYAGSVGGARPTLERALWSGVAVAFFLPVFDTLWKGNVSALLALQVALVLRVGTVSGIGLATAVLLKTTPMTLVPAALSAAGRRRFALLVGGAAVTVVSVALSPAAWLDFVRVLPNLLAGSSVVATNLAPHSVVASAFPTLPVVADAARLAAVAVAALAVVVSIVLARRPGRWPAATVAGVAALLLLPSSTWFHYLAALLPLAAFSWPRASARERALLLAGGTLVSFGVALLPLALLGAAVLTLTCLHALWPARDDALALAPQARAVAATTP